MNLKEAAEKLNLAEVTARRWIKTGRLQAEKVEGFYGPEYVISQEAIDRAKEMSRTPVIIQTNEPTATAAEVQRIIERAIDKGIGDRIQAIIEDSNQSILEEVQALRTAIEGIRMELAAEREPQRKSWRDIFRKGKKNHDQD